MLGVMQVPVRAVGTPLLDGEEDGGVTARAVDGGTPTWHAAGRDAPHSNPSSPRGRGARLAEPSVRYSTDLMVSVGGLRLPQNLGSSTLAGVIAAPGRLDVGAPGFDGDGAGEADARRIRRA